MSSATFVEIETSIRNKILEKCGREYQEARHAYALFGRPQNGIDKPAFKMHLNKFGIFLSEGDFNAVFTRYDVAKTGKIQFNDFIKKVFPQDYAQVKFTGQSVKKTCPWDSFESVKADPELRKTFIVPKTVPQRRPVLDPNADAGNWSVPSMKKILTGKIDQRIIASMDVKAQVYNLFMHTQSSSVRSITRDGLAYGVFAMTLRNKLGVTFNDTQMQSLWASFGPSAGKLDFQKFLNTLYPGDFGESNNWQYGEDFNKVRKGGRKPTIESASRSLRIRNPMSHRQICTQVSEKITERGHKFSGQQGGINSKDRFRHAYMLFGRPRNGIQLHLFRKTLQGIGVELSDDEWAAFFKVYAPEAAGGPNATLDLKKFLAAVLPSDYPEIRRTGKVHELTSSDANADWWKVKKSNSRHGIEREPVNMTLSLSKPAYVKRTMPVTKINDFDSDNNDLWQSSANLAMCSSNSSPNLASLNQRTSTRAIEKLGRHSRTPRRFRDLPVITGF